MELSVRLSISTRSEIEDFNGANNSAAGEFCVTMKNGLDRVEPGAVLVK